MKADSPVAAAPVAVREAAGDGLVRPLLALENAIRFWWFLFLLIIAGGLAGWLIHSTRPAVYEAVAGIPASIDLVRTGPLTQFEEDVALNAIQGVLLSSNLLDRVVSAAADEGITTSANALKRAATLERKVNVWEVRVRDTDPRRAEQLANVWVKQGHALLLDGYQHSLQAEQWQRVLNSLETCLGQSAGGEPTGVVCSHISMASIQAELDSAGKTYQQERAASLGLFPGLTIGPVSQAVIPQKPALYGRNQLVLAGCLIGLVAGAWLIQIGIPARWWKRS